DAADNFLGQKTVRREVQDDEVAPDVGDRVEDVMDVFAQEDLAAGKIGPRETGIPLDELQQFGRAQLVRGLALPDVAGLAAILTPVGERQVDFERPLWTCDVRVQNARRRKSMTYRDHVTSSRPKGRSGIREEPEEIIEASPSSSQPPCRIPRHEQQ